MATGKCMARLAVALSATMAVAGSVCAADVFAEWSQLGIPPPPELKPVTVDTKTTALLVLDLMKSNCGARPRCVESVPKVKALLERARAAGLLVAVHLPGHGPAIDPSLEPRPGEAVVEKLTPPERGGPDKFIGTDLDQRLKAAGIKTVIMVGTSAQGVGIGMSNAAVQRGYNVIYPVDGFSSESAFREAYAVWHLAGGGPPVVTKWVTVTRSDMIKF